MRNTFDRTKNATSQARGLIVKGSLRARLRDRSLKTIDRLRGMDFQEFVSREELGHDPDVCYDYAPSGDRFLKEILKDLHVTRSDAILDVGCGKGSAMRLMLKFPFTRVDGVELSSRLGTIATRNFQRMRTTRAAVFVGDAATFDRYGDYNVFYFFNPFSGSVMSKALARIGAPSRNPSEEAVLIYNNPTCHELFVESGLNKIREYPDQWGNRIFVYSNKPVELSRLGG